MVRFSFNWKSLRAFFAPIIRKLDLRKNCGLNERNATGK
jgi:hypothetical protein